MSESIRRLLRLTNTEASPEVVNQVLKKLHLRDQDIEAVDTVVRLLKEILRECAIAEFEAMRLKELEVKRQQAKTGFVYVFHLFSGIYKIGKSARPSQRFAEISSAVKRYSAFAPVDISQVEMTCVISTPDMDFSEQSLHTMYADLRVDMSLFDNPIETKLCLSTELFSLRSVDVEILKQTSFMLPDWWEVC